MNVTTLSAREAQTLRAGFFSIGLAAYWPQFHGLRERLDSIGSAIAARIERTGVILCNLGMIDSPDAAQQAAHRLGREDIDILFIHVATYALSSTVLPVLRRLKVPVVVLNLAPGPALDYARVNALGDRAQMTSEWLSFCQACSMPELGNVFNRSGIPFHQVNGMVHDDPEAWTEINEWLSAAHVVHAMEHNRLGLMGHPYGGMLDIYTDLTLQTIVFGTHIEMIEVEEFISRRRAVSDRAIAGRVELLRNTFTVDADCSGEELARAARSSVALDSLVTDQRLGSLTYFNRGVGVAESEDALSSIILGATLLTAKGVPVAGEFEVKNVQAMKILDLLGAGGSFTEYYATDFSEDVVLMGHDGPGHAAIADGPPRVRPLGVYHGKVGHGLSIEMSVRHGPVTLLAITENGRGGLKLVAAEGFSEPGPILEIGNTNSRYRFPIRARTFLSRWNGEGVAHHWAVGVGHLANTLRKLALLLKLEISIVR
jgi:L-arabinose isomerase